MSAPDSVLGNDDLLRLIVDGGHDCLLVLSLQGEILRATLPALRLMEAARETDLEGRDWLALWDRPERPAAQAALESARRGEAAQFTAFAYTLARTPRWWHTHVSPLPGGSEPRYLLAVSRDVTELRFQEQKVRELNARLEQRVEERTQELIRTNFQLNHALNEARDLYDRAPCGYYSLDAAGRFVAINDTALVWLGYSRDELVGRMGLGDLLDEAGRMRHAARMDWLRAGQPCPEEEYRIHRKDASSFDASIQAAAVFDFDGRFLNSRASMVDVTERRQARDAMQRLNADLQRAIHERSQALAQSERDRERLAQVNAELEGFSYTVSHDLRAPLRRVVSCIDMAAEQLGPQLGELAAQQLAHAREGAQHMRELIEALLGLAQLDRKPLQIMPLDMGLLVEEARSALLPECAGRVIEWRISPDFPQVSGDPLLLRQVWINLLSNAIKYSRPRAVASITVGHAPNASGAQAYFVQDNGVGFDAKLGGQLFGVFQRLHAANEFEGTGVGLALVRKIVQRHGGSIWAVGETDAGCTVGFSLPG